eukprot:COSAG05_NODE_3854_length_1805_cov_7.212192_1_plen_146_part_00
MIQHMGLCQAAVDVITDSTCGPGLQFVAFCSLFIVCGGLPFFCAFIINGALGKLPAEGGGDGGRGGGMVMLPDGRVIPRQLLMIAMQFAQQQAGPDVEGVGAAEVMGALSRCSGWTQQTGRTATRARVRRATSLSYRATSRGYPS